jgi:hypothetical protein
MGEGLFAMEKTYQGYDVKRIHVGGDYVVQNQDFRGRKIGRPITHEIKTGHSKLGARASFHVFGSLTSALLIGKEKKKRSLATRFLGIP